MVDTMASTLAFLVPVTQRMGSVTPVLGSVSASAADLLDKPFDSFINAGS